jgi:HEAT repeat protein
MKLDAVLAGFRAHGDLRQRSLILRLAKSPAQALPILTELAGNQYPPSVQRWAIEGLGRLPERLAWPLVSQALRSPHMSVRLHAICAVRDFGNRRRAAALRPLLRDSSGGIRVNALAVVGEFRPPWLKAELKRASRDPKDYVRRLAARLSLEGAR